MKPKPAPSSPSSPAPRWRARGSHPRAVQCASLAAASLLARIAYGDTATPVPERAGAPQKLGAWLSTGYLGSPAGSGVALSSGVRLALGTHAALSADLGYGVLCAPYATQDRWWIMPAIAWVFPGLPTGGARLDVGAGLGLGASSGYASFADYARGPFSPAWAFQLVPAARAHVMAATPVGRDVDVFVRIEAAALFLAGTDLGFRNGNANPAAADTTWLDLAAGVELRIL